jgi:hypothetical protein
MTSSLTTFLMHEISRFNRLFKTLRDSLESIKRVLRGLDVASETIE